MSREPQIYRCVTVHERWHLWNIFNSQTIRLAESTAYGINNNNNLLFKSIADLVEFARCLCRQDTAFLIVTDSSLTLFVSVCSYWEKKKWISTLNKYRMDQWFQSSGTSNMWAFALRHENVNSDSGSGSSRNCTTYSTTTCSHHNYDEWMKRSSVVDIIIIITISNVRKLYDVYDVHSFRILIQLIHVCKCKCLRVCIV